WANQITGTFGTGDTINLSSSLFPPLPTLSGPNPNPVIQLNGTQLPTISANVSIVGAQDPNLITVFGVQQHPAPQSTISGEQKSRVFEVGTGASVTLTVYNRFSRLAADPCVHVLGSRATGPTVTDARHRSYCGVLTTCPGRLPLSSTPRLGADP